ncbi:spike base protein, RCAP_Rcc01079 family [Sideroxydans lithotrophicus]|uniref:Uncharacterized protein n=1 Tax=Sideroxydans lithotrophicus (strain ES-1) TaxID=580332 RepID=D5CT56_SIDLE|nr:hypothetical protein [Sideroxydans lithotrophicus]ADE12142.1 hypothetical protein Slit_1913 [Sideroxydans lithotrophicus ES-1]
MNKTYPKTAELQAVGENYTGAAAVTTSDTAAVAYDGLWVGGAGNVKVDMANGQTGVTFTAVPAGTLLKIAVTKVYATGTTATNMNGLTY